MSSVRSEMTRLSAVSTDCQMLIIEIMSSGSAGMPRFDHLYDIIILEMLVFQYKQISIKPGRDGKNLWNLFAAMAI